MAWWTVAAALAPVAFDGIRAMTGGEEENPYMKGRMALHKMLQQRANTPALQQPGAQAALAEVDRSLDREKEADQADDARAGVTGSEVSIARTASRGSRRTDAILGVTRAGESQRQHALAQLLGSQRTLETDRYRERLLDERRTDRLAQGAGAAAYAFGQNSLVDTKKKPPK